MDRVYESGASATPPTPPATPSTGYPSRGNPTTGVMATVPGPYIFHQLVEEVMGVIAAAGLTPDSADLTQLKQALDARYTLAGAGSYLPRIGDPAQDIALHSATFASSPVMGLARQLPIGYDLNTLNDSGFFDGQQLLNAPNGRASWFYVVSTVHSNSVLVSNQYAQQMAFFLSSQEVWVRNCHAGAWSAWDMLTTQAYVDAQVAASAPVGTIFDFAGRPVDMPAGMLRLPLSPTNVSRTSYAKLFAAINTAWGAGDGATTFGLPWMPVGYTTLQDSNHPGTFGTLSAGQVMAHSHTTSIPFGTIGGAANQCVTSALYQSAYDWPSTVVGGAANLAAGVLITKMIKYI